MFISKFVLLLHITLEGGIILQVDTFHWVQMKIQQQVARDFVRFLAKVAGQGGQLYSPMGVEKKSAWNGLTGD